MRVEDLKVENRVHPHLDVVPGDADLLGNVDGLLLQGVLVGRAFDEGKQDVKARLERTAVLTEVFDHEGALLRNHDGGLGDHEDDQGHDDQCGDQGFH